MKDKLLLLLSFCGYFITSLADRCGYYAHCYCPDSFTLYCSGSLPLNVNELKQSAPLEHVLLFDGRGRDIGLYFIPNLVTYAPRLKKARLENCNCEFIVPYLDLDLPFEVTHSCTVTPGPTHNGTITVTVGPTHLSDTTPYTTTELPTLPAKVTTQDTIITSMTAPVQTSTSDTSHTTDTVITTSPMTSIILSSITPTRAVTVPSPTSSAHYTHSVYPVSSTTPGGYHPTSHGVVSFTFNIYLYVLVPITATLTGIVSVTMGVLCCYKCRHGHYPRCSSDGDEENQLGGGDGGKYRVKKEPGVKYTRGASNDDDGSITFTQDTGKTSSPPTDPGIEMTGISNPGARFDGGNCEPSQRTKPDKVNAARNDTVTAQSHVQGAGNVTLSDERSAQQGRGSRDGDTLNCGPSTPRPGGEDLNMRSAGPQRVQWPYFNFMSKLKKNVTKNPPAENSTPVCKDSHPVSSDAIKKEPPSPDRSVTNKKAPFFSFFSSKKNKNVSDKESPSGGEKGEGSDVPSGDCDSPSHRSAQEGLNVSPVSVLTEVKKEPCDSVELAELSHNSSATPSAIAGDTPSTPTMETPISPCESVAVKTEPNGSDSPDPQTLIKNFVSSPAPDAKRLVPSPRRSSHGSDTLAEDLDMSQEDHESSRTGVVYVPDVLSSSIDSTLTDLINFSNSFQSDTIKEEPSSPIKKDPESDDSSDFPWSNYHTPACSTPSRPPPPSMGGSPELPGAGINLDDSTSSNRPLLTPKKSVKLSSIKRRVGYSEIQSNWDLRYSTPVKKVCTLPQCEDSPTEDDV